MNPGQHIFIFGVRIYQCVLSPAKTVLFGPAGHCRFEPTCSQYAIEAARTHGVLRGSALAAWRVCRCHPWGGCGADPVPPATPRRPAETESLPQATSAVAAR